jgi:hypothetical protein
LLFYSYFSLIFLNKDKKIRIKIRMRKERLASLGSKRKNKKLGVSYATPFLYFVKKKKERRKDERSCVANLPYFFLKFKVGQAKL